MGQVPAPRLKTELTEQSIEVHGTHEVYTLAHRNPQSSDTSGSPAGHISLAQSNHLGSAPL